MGRPRDQETIVTEKIVCYSQFPRGGACHATPHRVPGTAPGQSGGRGTKGCPEMTTRAGGQWPDNGGGSKCGV